MIQKMMKHILWGLALSISLFACNDDDNNNTSNDTMYDRPEEPGDAAFSSAPITEGASLWNIEGLEAALKKNIMPIYSNKNDYTAGTVFADFYVSDLPDVASDDYNATVARKEWLETEAGRQRLEYFKKFLTEDMVFVQGGTFLMGGTAEQGDGLHTSIFPVHKVTVDDFYMCRFEVTQELFSYVIGKWYKWSYADGMYADYPADKRKMSEIKTFCDNLSKLTGKRLIFDLPTEAEWEFAARGGRKRVSTMFAGSDDFSKVGNCYEDCFRFNAVSNKMMAWPQRVMQKAPNELGLYDMSGNMIEICKNEFKNYTESDQVNPGKDEMINTTNFDLLRVTRGGGYSVTPDYCRIAVRGGKNLEKNDATIGFRVICRISTEAPDDGDETDETRPEEPGDAYFSDAPLKEGASLLTDELKTELLNRIPVIYSDKNDYNSTKPFYEFYASDLPNVSSKDANAKQARLDWLATDAGQKRIKYFNDFFDKDMVFVEGGTFLMGGTAEQGDGLSDNVFPVHKVTVDDFYMCRFEVTQELYSYVIGKWYIWSYGDGLYADYPADKRNMSDIKTFCENLSKLTGNKYTFDLPTEAEWEFAARGGRKRKQTMFSGSNDFTKVGFCNEDCVRLNGVSGKEEAWPQRVKQKEPNELGLYDMSGNIIEICKDEFKNYTADEQINPGKEASITDFTLTRVIRGGGFNDRPSPCRVLVRNGKSLSARDITIGFRVVCRPTGK